MRKACVPLLLSGLLLAPVAFAEPPTSSHQVREPFSTFVHYACGPQETVQLSGHFHRHVWEHTDGNGIRHRFISYNLQGVSGMGATSGDRYIAITNEKSTQSYELIENDTQVDVHGLLIIRLIREGAEDDAWLYFSRDETYVYSSEDPIDSRVRFWTECRG